MTNQTPVYTNKPSLTSDSQPSYIAPAPTRTTNTAVPVAATPVRQTDQHVTTTHPEEKKGCPKALLGLLGVLALAGIILGLLFGLGVIGGRGGSGGSSS